MCDVMVHVLGIHLVLECIYMLFKCLLFGLVVCSLNSPEQLLGVFIHLSYLYVAVGFIMWVYF